MITKYKFLTLVLIFSFFWSTGYSQRREKTHPNFTREDLILTMSDGAVLDCSKFYPDNSPPAGGWPAIIYCHGYGGSKEDLVYAAAEQSQYGYYCFIYSMRGQGFSTGKSNLISTTEMNDFLQILNYVKSDPLVKASRVGATGGSQGGIIPYMAACNGAGLRCVASEVMSPEFATSWIENKCVRMTLLWTVSYDTSIARYNNQVARYRSWILSDTPDKWDSLAYYMPINRDFANTVSQNTVATHSASVWQDKFFNVYGIIKQLGNMSNPQKFYFGTLNAHGGDPNTAEQNFYGFMLGEWLDYWLLDLQNHIMDSSKFVYAASSYPRQSNTWTWTRYYSNVWSPAGVEDVRFYLTPGLKLRTVANNSNPDTLGFLNDIKDQTLTMTEAVNREFTGTVFDSKFGKTQIAFETPPLVQDTRMVGTPLVNIHYRCDTDKSQFNFQIWEVQPDNTANLVGRANATERNITPNVIRQLTFYGTSHSHNFKSGNRIRIVLTNLDNIADDAFIRTNPYVLPSLKRARNVIYMNPANQTSIQLPLIGYIPNDIISNTLEVPQNYYLAQNYPNPFNPLTRIKFGIPGNAPVQTVRLYIYDITGREIAKLVDEQLKPGVHEVIWNAGNMPSGIYFYKIQTDKYSEAKRMILIK
ncbi:MAG TPA: alpha/beta fold hydrolase [Ignavibacteria bacterium]